MYGQKSKEAMASLAFASPTPLTLEHLGVLGSQLSVTSRAFYRILIFRNMYKVGGLTFKIKTKVCGLT